MSLVVLVGHSSSGKSTARKILEEEEYKGFEASTYARLIRAVGNVTDLIDFFTRQENKLLVLERILEDVKTCKAEQIVISGLRIPEELRLLRSSYSPMRVVGVYCSLEICFRRSLIRPDKSFKSFSDFVQTRIYEDNALGLADIFSRELDCLVNNNSSLYEFRQRILEVVKDV